VSLDNAVIFKESIPRLKYHEILFRILPKIENGRKNNRGLKEINPIFTITRLDYFPHMSVFHQERTGFDHH
jgi:hypothetical protein